MSFTYPTAKMSIGASAKIMLMGDSITADSVGIKWWLPIKNAADARFGGSAPTWFNFGVSGYECSNVDADMVLDLAAVPNPTHVIVRIGINDVLHGTAIAASRVSIASFCAKMLAGGVAADHIMLVDNLVWGERPIDGANTAKGGNDAGILTINRTLQYFAKNNGFIFAETRDQYWRPWELAHNTTAPPVGHGLFTTTDDGFAGQLGVHPTTPAGRDLLGGWVLNNYIRLV